MIKIAVIPDPDSTARIGAVAQLGERLGRIEEVVSSSLICSTSPPAHSLHAVGFFYNHTHDRIARQIFR